MAKVLWGGVQQLFDNLGDVLNGGSLTFYAGGTSTPLAAYTDSVGGTALANPLTVDSAGRESGGVWFTEGVAYKVVVKDSGGVTLDTIDNITLGDAASSSAEEIDITFSFVGTPTAQGSMGTYPATRAFTFPIDFAGSRGSVGTNPASTYTISAKKDGVEIGTISISTAGVFTFATTSGTTHSFTAGNVLTLTGPSAVGTAADIGITLLADID